MIVRLTVSAAPTVIAMASRLIFRGGLATAGLLDNKAQSPSQLT